MSPRAGWILHDEIAPRLRYTIPKSVSYVGSEDAEELVQDGIAFAARMLHAAEESGKEVTPGNVAYYAAQHVRSGRRSTGTSRVDVMASQTQIQGVTRLNSLQEVVSSDAETGSDIFELQDVLAQDQEDPSQIAARNLDWETLMSRLTDRERAIVEYLLEGKTVVDVAAAFKLSRSTLQTAKNRLAAMILEVLGMDILVEVRRLPGWRDDMNTHRATLSCRQERRN